MTKENISNEPWSFKTWYADNREKLAETRKFRYHNDQSYRTRILQYGKNTRNKNKEIMQSTPSSTTKRRLPVSVDVLIFGQPDKRTAISIGNLANQLNVSVSVIYAWERNKMIPVTPIKLGRNRYYTSEMADALASVFASRNNDVKIGDLTFFDEVTKRWTALGVL